MTGKRMIALALAVIVVVALGGLSRVRYSHEPGVDAVLRLAWRARSVRVQVCRHRSADELARLPVHMREDDVCERQLLPYLLRVEVDNQLVVDEVVRAAGVRQDRPIYVFQEVALQPGTHRLSVRFDRQGTAPAEAEEAHAEEQGVPRAAPPALALDTLVQVTKGDIRLITYDEEGGRLVFRRGR